MKLPTFANSIKSSLATLFNETLTNLRNESPQKDQIVLGEGFLHKKDVTNSVTKLLKDVLRREEDEWTVVRPERAQLSPQRVSETFVTPTSNRFTALGNE